MQAEERPIYHTESHTPVMSLIKYEMHLRIFKIMFHLKESPFLPVTIFFCSMQTSLENDK